MEKKNQVNPRKTKSGFTTVGPRKKPVKSEATNGKWRYYRVKPPPFPILDTRLPAASSVSATGHASFFLLIFSIFFFCLASTSFFFFDFELFFCFSFWVRVWYVGRSTAANLVLTVLSLLKFFPFFLFQDLFFFSRFRTGSY